MTKRFKDQVKMDIGLVSQALNNTNATGRYFSLAEYGKAIANLNGGAMAATKTTKVEFLQAKDAAGTGSKALTNAEATITANTKATEATVTLATFLAGGTVTINGLVFTAHATTTTAANREFSISGTDTADATELVNCINNATYGVPGVVATSNLGVVTLKSSVPGETVITVDSSDPVTTAAVATTQANAFVEVDSSQLDVTNGFTHVAVKVTTTANTNVAVNLLRGLPRWTPEQKVGASAVL